jgi:phage terminase large subunit GpA-like protein
MKTKTAKALRTDPRSWDVRYRSIANLETRLLSAVREGFHQPPFLSVTDWAAQNRFLTGAEAGRYDPRRCRYQREIQDCFCDSEVREITWQAAERVGKSTVASNIIGFIVDREPSNILMVMPTRESMGDFAKDELEVMLRSSPSLWNKVSAGRVSMGKTSNIRRRTFLGGVLSLVGGGSSSPLAFRTVRVVVLDEIDKFKNIPGEGDADALAAKRVSTYGEDFKVLRFSKPTVEGESRIARHFARGSQAQYFVSCPQCGEFQVLSWSALRFDDVAVRCVHCNAFHDQDAWLSSPAEWRHAAPEIHHHRSFQCSVLVSPLIRWETLIGEYREAIAALQAGDPSLVQVWENSRLGQVFSGRVDRIEPGTLYARREVF